MAYSPIAFTAANYRDYKNYWLKAYEPGTTTAKSMATDSTLATTIIKAEININGFIKSTGGALITPYIDGAYDLWLFPTEAEADANDTSEALRLADNIIGVGGEAVASNAKYNPTTIQAAIDSTEWDINGGEVFEVQNGRGKFLTVLSSTVTENEDNIFQGVGVPTISLVKLNNTESVNTLSNDNERLHNGSNGAIVFIFDDNKRTVYDNGLPAFQSQGEVANMALIADRFVEREAWDSSNFSLADALEMQGSGWEVVCHGYDLSTVFNVGLDLDLGNEELEQSFNALNRMGLDVKQFVAPSSVFDSKFLPKAQVLFSAVHIGSNTSDASVATPNNGNDAYDLRRVSLEENLTTTGLFNAFVDYCKANNTLGIVYAHEVDGTFGTTPLTTARLNSHIDYCQSSGVPILTVSDALQRFNTNTVRGEFLGGEKPKNLDSFKVKHSNLLSNSAFNSTYDDWVFATGTVGATARVDGGNTSGQFVFEIGAGAGSGTTQISQAVDVPTSKTARPLFASVVASVADLTVLDGQDLIIQVDYLVSAAIVGTKTKTYPLTKVATKYELSDFIKHDTSADQLKLSIKVANNNPGQAADVQISEASLGFDDGAWLANDNKTYVKSRRTTTQTGVTSAGAVVAFATTSDDVLGEYDDAGTFTASRAGTLTISSSVMINDLGFGYDMTKLLLDIRKNSAAVVRGSTLIATGGDRFGEPAVAITADIKVLSGDTIDIFLSHNGTTSMIVDPNDNATWLIISG